MTSRTLPADTLTPEAPARASTGPQLYLLLQCEGPLGTSARFLLDAIDVVVIGRGDRLEWEHVENEQRYLLVRTPDPRMSQLHARILRRPEGFVLEDSGSRNGSQRNGAPVQRAVLEDGDLLELGYTMFLFRADAPLPPDPAECVVVTSVDAPQPALVTLCPPLQHQLAILPRMADSPVPVMISGESGTGKGLVARAMHDLSARRGPFVAVNCGALPETLVETELFGYKKGAFSGAQDDRPGLVRSADGGTLFLDEIADLPLEIQAAFLRVLQEREVVPVGGTKPVHVDLHLISATHGDLATMVRERRFRADLYARIAGLTLALPPLRRRREDLGLLAGALLQRLSPGRKVALSRSAARAICLYAWPLNVRELEQCLGAAATLAGGGSIGLEHLPGHVQATLSRPGARPTPPPERARPSGPVPIPAPDVAADPDDPVRAALLAALTEHQGNVSAVARAMGKARMQIQRWLKRYNLDPETFKR